MPELPEVETIVQTLSRKIKGLEVTSYAIHFPGLMRTEEATLSHITGKKITGIRRRGKFILFDFESGYSLLFHLKMTGQFLLSEPAEGVDKHTHFILAFRENCRELRFRDVRKFGVIRCLETVESFNLNLGPEPLEVSFPRFKSLFKGRKARVKSLLLDQGFLAGIGNIYADEILFEAGIHPLTPGSSLEDEQLERLWKAMKSVLRRAIRHRGSSIRDYRDAEGMEGGFQDFHKVYGKEHEPCQVCGEKVRRIRISGRSSFFCPRCQKRGRKFR